ncbi:MAG: diphosphomevalonate decarboxylase [Bacteroidia bacterium]|jgi:diphosphomevalonate decarboxylase
MKESNTARWQSPSNIALIKYWGKKGFQLPSNASISFTLNACNTTTLLRWIKKDAVISGEDVQIRVLLDGIPAPSFEPKITSFFNKIKVEHPELEKFRFEIETSNTFPHSSGIASSASGMSALALCVCSMLEELGGKFDFYQHASHLARIGSGSASRSVYGGVAMWGVHEAYAGSSDLFAIPIKDIHDNFQQFNDVVLLVHEGQKSVSSTVGHGLLKDHPLAKKRFQLAQENMAKMKTILQEGNIDNFVELIEHEALMLHSLMMTSSPSFILMLPNTLAIIKKIREDRKQNGGHITFTLDAGANVHMLFPNKDEAQAMNLVKNQLVGFCSNGRYICDKIGQGPKKL